MDMGPIDVPLPLDKLSLPSSQSDSVVRTNCESKKYVVLLSPGSFNPPTYMHLRIFELAKDALRVRGYFVVGGYMSPVNDAYKKKGLLSSKDRLQMCELACKSSSFIMVDPWEARQSSYQRTFNVLSRVYNSLLKSGLFSRESLQVMLLCGSDMLESFSIPGFWIRDQVKSICKDFGIVCIRREGKDIDKILSSDEILFENKDNIVAVDEIVPNQISSTRIKSICKDFGIVCIRREGKDIDKILSSDEILFENKDDIVAVDEIVPNQISSTRIRECIKRGLSVKYLVPDEVIDYIGNHQLYLLSDG